jgi:hypothetical protein
MKKYIYLFLLLAAYVPASLQAQSGWTEPKKHTFKIRLQYILHLILKRRNELKTSEFTQNATSLYGEYGITDRLTAIGYIPFSNKTATKQLTK